MLDEILDAFAPAYIYANLPRNAIVRLAHPRSGESQDQIHIMIHIYVSFLFLYISLFSYFYFIPNLRIPKIIYLVLTLSITFPSGIYLLKVNNGNTRTRCEICSKLTIKTPEQRQWRRSRVF